jgi:nucleotide-binding universal stress UspA family protein
MMASLPDIGHGKGVFMFEKILVALDESEHAAQVLAVATEVATKFDSDVRVLHVLETGFVGKAGVVSLENSAEKHQLVDDAVGALTSGGIKATGAVCATDHGRVAAEINTEAVQFGAGLIITGSHGLGNVAGLLVGSTTHKLLHLSAVPILVTP